MVFKRGDKVRRKKGMTVKQANALKGNPTMVDGMWSRWLDDEVFTITEVFSNDHICRIKECGYNWDLRWFDKVYPDILPNDLFEV